MDLSSFKTPTACSHPDTIQRVLRLSRRATDDNLASELSRQSSCEERINAIFGEWQQRDALLVYCENQLKDVQAIAEHERRLTGVEALSQTARKKIVFSETTVDPRVDPYSARDEIRKMANWSTQWIENERITESIVRDTTVDILVQKCGDLGTHAAHFYRKYTEFCGHPPAHWVDTRSRQ